MFEELKIILWNTFEIMFRIGEFKQDFVQQQQ